MKRLFFSLLFSLMAPLAYSQPVKGGGMTNGEFADSILRMVQQSTNDSIKAKLLIDLGYYYSFTSQDSSIFYFAQGIELAENSHNLAEIHLGYLRMSFVLNAAGNYSKALEMALKSLKVAEQFKVGRLLGMGESYDVMGLINRRWGNDTIARDQCLQAIRLCHEAGASAKGLWGGIGALIRILP